MNKKLLRKNKTWKESHGLSRSQLYRVYWGTIERCENPNDPSYERYGARGIKMCKEWRENFVRFAQWSFENGYYEERNEKNMNKCTLDRIDPRGDYSPENCRWTDKHTQSANRHYKKNKSGYTGVYWTIPNKKWRSEVGTKHKRIFLGLFNTPKDAHIARVMFIKDNNLTEYPEFYEEVL